MGSCIATFKVARSVLSPDDKEQTEISVLLGKPKQFSDSPDHYCPYRIVGIGDEKIWHIGGVDAVQAIQLAMVAIGALLYRLNEKSAGRIRWDAGEGDDLGFPLPKAA
jgi:hypothetical protein